MLQFSILVLAVIALTEAGSSSQMGESEMMEMAEKFLKEYSSYTGKKIVLNDNGFAETKPEDVKFIFYNSPEYNTKVTGNLNESEFSTSPVFNKSYDTKLLIHGWLQADNPQWSANTSFRYALRGNKVNFVKVDWTSCAYYPYNVVVESKVPKVAEYVAEMVNRLIMKGADPKRIHLIGFGTGAHIAGLAGKKLTKKIGRITGLSPSKLMWSEKSEKERLNKGDADFVDVIHTNMGVYGFPAPIGDVDFFPEGGKMQPAAKNFPAFKNLISHLMARSYYTESIDLGVSFIGKIGNSWRDFLGKKTIYNAPVVMGEYATNTNVGKVYLSVNDCSPYGKGAAGAYYEEKPVQSNSKIY